MFRQDAKEAAPLLQRALAVLLSAIPTRGRPGADVRTACGDLSANAESLLSNDVAAPPLVNCFNLAQQTGATQPQLATVRNSVLAETPVTLGATLTKNSIIHVCLATEAGIISNTKFVSRDDVDALKAQMNGVFSAMEEVAADDMDQMTYRALVELHAAITGYLVDTARPLPRMLRFQFAAPQSTLIAAQRLYYDASRANQLRDENHVVHPAFMLPLGRALSA
jgi:prophage DNA circulation protein